MLLYMYLQTCCYDLDTFAIMTSSEGGSWISPPFVTFAELNQEREARDVCCAAGTCSRFFEVRPSPIWTFFQRLILGEQDGV